MGTNRQHHSVWREYLEALLVAGLFLGFTNTFVLKTFYIPSGSMEDTLLVGDHLVVNRFIYGASPGWARSLLPMRPLERGDIVVFRSPEDPRIDLVKRCIALPGDTVEIVRKQLYINDQAVDDDLYTLHRDPQIGRRPTAFDYQRFKRDNLERFAVPERHYFCLGDNRDESYDSRYWGPVPAHFVKGRAFMIYWSYGGEGTYEMTSDLGEKVARLGRTALGFLTKTRWERTFELVR